MISNGFFLEVKNSCLSIKKEKEARDIMSTTDQKRKKDTILSTTTQDSSLGLSLFEDSRSPGGGRVHTFERSRSLPILKTFEGVRKKNQSLKSSKTE